MSKHKKFKVKRFHSSDKKKEIYNHGLIHAFEFANKLIKKKIYDFKVIYKTKYDEHVNKGHDYYFNQTLNCRIIDIIYNNCSDYNKKRLEILYAINKINKIEFSEFLKELEEKFGVYLCKKGYPFSDEFKNKYNLMKIEEGRKFDGYNIYLDKLGEKNKSKYNIVIEKIPDYSKIIEKFNLNKSEIEAKKNINNDDINELIKNNLLNPGNISEKSTLDNFDNNNTINNFDNNNTNDNNNNNYFDLERVKSVLNDRQENNNFENETSKFYIKNSQDENSQDENSQYENSQYEWNLFGKSYCEKY